MLYYVILCYIDDVLEEVTDVDIPSSLVQRIEAEK